MRGRLRGAVCWRHLPQVLNWRIRRVGRAGFVVRGRAGRYTGYSPGLRYAVTGGSSARETYESLRRTRATRKDPEFKALMRRVAARYDGTP